MSKDRGGRLLNRDNLGGISAPIAEAQVANSFIFGGPAAYRTAQGTYVAFRAGSDTLKTFRITATNPPTIASGWIVFRGSGTGCGSPWVTSTDGTNNMIVWVVGTPNRQGTGGDQRLHGYDGDTGAVVYAGGGANELMAGTHSYSTTGIVARGRIYVATDNKVYAFKLPEEHLRRLPPLRRHQHQRQHRHRHQHLRQHGHRHRHQQLRQQRHQQQHLRRRQRPRQRGMPAIGK